MKIFIVSKIFVNKISIWVLLNFLRAISSGFFLNPNSPENVRERIAFSKKLLNELTTLDSSEITSPFSIGKVVG